MESSGVEVNMTSEAEESRESCEDCCRAPKCSFKVDMASWRKEGYTCRLFNHPVT